MGSSPFGSRSLRRPPDVVRNGERCRTTRGTVRCPTCPSRLGLTTSGCAFWIAAKNWRTPTIPSYRTSSR